ncbi:hypothetical protein MKX01_018489 [Papaver californicum]|nr:hypothetical protein MKX01_018489 [Papaver californicum]
MASTQSKDSEFTQETRDLLSSIPKQKAWMRSDQIYQYNNFWYGAVELQTLDSDLVVATYPKCGTTWLKALCFAIINRYHFNTATSKQHHPLLTNNPHLLLSFLDHLYSADQNPDLTLLVNLYICRDPKDALISYWHFITKIRTKNLENISLEEFYKQFCEGVVEYGPFWDHVPEYWKMSLQFPAKLAQFLGYPFSAEEESEGVVEGLLKLCSFDHLSSLEVNKNGKLPVLEVECSTFFRRGEVGDHINYLTPAMVGRLNQMTEEKFVRPRFDARIKLVLLSLIGK